MPPLMEIEVIRSPRRRKTVEARKVDGTVRLSIPASMSATEEAHWVDEMTRRFAAPSAGLDLARRARVLSERYGLQCPSVITWVGNQHTRWGSCTPATGKVRISERVAAFPRWVVDYVIVHELAHLTVPGHTPEFWELVGRYELTERARGFLIAKGLDG